MVKSTKFEEEAAAVTKAVVAIAVELFSAACVTPIVPVGNVGVPVNVGETLITTLPVPVIALETTFLLASVNKACEAVALESTGAAVRVVTPVTASVPPRVVLPPPFTVNPPAVNPFIPKLTPYIAPV